MFPVFTKDQALERIVGLMRVHGVTLPEIQTALQTPAPSGGSSLAQGFLNGLLAYVGSVLVFAGIAIYFGVMWDDLSSFSRVAMTIGAGVVALILGLVAGQNASFDRAATPLLLIGALTEATGLGVYLKEYSEGGNVYAGEMFITGLMTAELAVLFYALRRTALAFLAILFFMGFCQSVMSYCDWDAGWIGFVLGLSGVAIAYGVGGTSHRSIAPFGYVISTIAVFFAGFEIIATSADGEIAAMQVFGIECAVLTLFFREMRRTALAFFAILAYMGFCRGALLYVGLPAEWVVLTLGISGLAIAWGVDRTPYHAMAPFGYFMSGIAVYVASFDLLHNTELDSLLIGAPAGLVGVSVAARSRTMLFVAVCSLLAALAYYTEKYFADMVGWPIALIVVGLVMMGLSGYAIKLGRDFGKPEPDAASPAPDAAA